MEQDRKNENRPAIRLGDIVLDCKNPKTLSAFYQRLLGWEITLEEDDWITIQLAGGLGTGLSFQENPSYLPPTWPEKAQEQQQMLHLDFFVDELEETSHHAVACGAKLSPVQYSKNYRVFFDPEGHTFCLCLQHS